MSFRYIGSKARLKSAIATHLGEGGKGRGLFVDVFCGTGTISEVAADLGWGIRINDHLNLQRR